ncbi:hypothetical protein GCM10012283_27690 [Phycicoccus endophyticus]|nr:hypothetical protein GCM10012283_27690 [Phycicoccus endophyticus]
MWENSGGRALGGEEGVDTGDTDYLSSRMTASPGREGPGCGVGSGEALRPTGSAPLGQVRMTIITLDTPSRHIPGVHEAPNAPGVASEPRCSTRPEAVVSP